MSKTQYGIFVAIVAIACGVATLFVPAEVTIGFVMFILGVYVGMELRAWAVPDPIKEKK
jgi:hypothetical protein